MYKEDRREDKKNGEGLKGQKNLKSITGISKLSSTIILSNIGDINDFDNSKKLCAYAGLVPHVYDSNESIRHGRITKRGDKILRTTLVQVALTAIKYSTYIRDYMNKAKTIFAVGSKKEAINRFNEWKIDWQIEEERAVKCLEKDLFDCLHYYDFDKPLWKVVRTTDVLERAFREIRRRTRPMNLFPNAESCNKIMYNVSKALNENWKRVLGST